MRHFTSFLRELYVSFTRAISTSFYVSYVFSRELYVVLRELYLCLRVFHALTRDITSHTEVAAAWKPRANQFIIFLIRFSKQQQQQLNVMSMRPLPPFVLLFLAVVSLRIICRRSRLCCVSCAGGGIRFSVITIIAPSRNGRNANNNNSVTKMAPSSILFSLFRGRWQCTVVASQAASAINVEAETTNRQPFISAPLASTGIILILK